MTSVFVDAAYWIAIARPNDQWNRAAKDARSKLGEVRLITTDEILTEFLTGLSKGGPYLRAQAVKAVRVILSNPNVKVIPQSRKSFLDGLARYEQSRDKAFSLQDCTSMNVMESDGTRGSSHQRSQLRAGGFRYSDEVQGVEPSMESATIDRLNLNSSYEQPETH